VTRLVQLNAIPTVDLPCRRHRDVLGRLFILRHYKCERRVTWIHAMTGFIYSVFWRHFIRDPFRFCHLSQIINTTITLYLMFTLFTLLSSIEYLIYTTFQKKQRGYTNYRELPTTTETTEIKRQLELPTTYLQLPTNTIYR